MRWSALLLVMICLLSLANTALAAKATPKPTLGPANKTGPNYDSEHPESLTADQLYAEAAILIDQSSGKVLFEKNPDKKMYPASTTKVMTLLLALEYGHLNDVVTIPKEAADVPGDSSLVPVKPGEKMPFIDLLHGFMIRSGNDAGNAIAVIVAGSVDKFVDLMNQRAAELGCSGTHFANPHGYYDDNHYTTARDLASIARTAMKNETFRKIVSTTAYTLPATSEREELTVYSTNQFVLRNTQTHKYIYKYGTGIKTGYTSKSGHTFVGAASKNGIDLISVVLKSTVAYSQAKWLDSARLMEYGFSKFRQYSFADLYGIMPVKVQVQNAAEEDPMGGLLTLDLVQNSLPDYSELGFEDDLEELAGEFAGRLNVAYTHDLKAPISKGDILGTLTFTPESGTPIETLLISSRDVEAAPVTPPSLGDLLGFVQESPIELSASSALWLLIPLALVVLLIVHGAVRRARRNRRRRRYDARNRARREYDRHNHRSR